MSKNRELPIIYCDLDDTLVGFIAGADRVLEHYGAPKWEDPHWKTMSNKQADDERWEIINKYPRFWAKLQWLKDGQVLWNYIKPYQPHILTAVTPYMATCGPEKFEWIQNNLSINSNDRIHLVARSEKKLYAKTDGVPNLLIDDYHKNCSEFRAAGGIAIEHKNASDTIQQLKKMRF